VICIHLAAQGVRHPEFLQKAGLFFAGQGFDIIDDPDLPQLQRVKSLEDTFEVLAHSQLAVLRRAPESRRFVVNDKGYMTLQDSINGMKGVFFPLSCDLMILAVPGSKPDGGWADMKPQRDLVLTPGGTEVLNRACWQQDGIKCLIGHPDDSSRIGKLSRSDPLVVPGFGPYRGAGGYGFFDWIVPASH
jgi:hypothetical protein